MQRITRQEPSKEPIVEPDRSTGGRALAAVLVLVVAIALGIGTAGCGAPANPQVSKLINEANAHLTNAANQVKTLGDFNTRFKAILTGQPNPQAAAQVRGLLEAARQKEQRALDETRQAKSALSKVKDLPISDNMKHYIDLKVSALSEQEQALVLELQAMDLRIATMKRIEAGESFADVLPQEKQINDLELQWADHMAQSTDLNKQAKAFYQEKKLGK